MSPTYLSCALLAALVLVAVVWTLWERRALQVAGIGVMVPGAHALLVAPAELESVHVSEALRAAFAPLEGRAFDDRSPVSHRPAPPPGGPEVMDGVVPGAIAGGVGLADWMHVDPNVLDAVGQWTHSDLHNHFDLLRSMLDHDYHLNTAGFAIKLRGHVAEQEVFDQLSSWAGTDLSVPEASNNPAFDLTLGGHDFNVKVGADASTIAEHLRSHPDIPVMVNADMTNLPADALHVDLTQAVDADLLAGHSVVVVDGLTLSDLHGQMADALGPAMDGFDITDLVGEVGDLGFPVLGSAIRVVRSGIREKQLLSHHGDTQRAYKNVGTDVAIVGGSVAAGGALGMGLGALIDIATLGATGGLGTMVVGPLIGSWLGGRKGNQMAAGRRQAPLVAARTAAADATTAYSVAVTEAVLEGNRRWTTTEVPRAQAKLDASAGEAEHRMDVVLAHARRDLRRIEKDAQHLAVATVRERADRMSQGGDPLALWARRRRINWQRDADEAMQAGDANACLDLLCAVDGAAPSVKQLMVDASQRQAQVLAAVGEAGRRSETGALEARAAVVRDLQQRRDVLRVELQSKTYPAAMNIWTATQRVRVELIATGSATPEWVKENIPDVPKPAPPTAPINPAAVKSAIEAPTGGDRLWKP